VPTAWQKGMQERRPGNVVAVALANKIARTAWAIRNHLTTAILDASVATG
jgi:transposase